MADTKPPRLESDDPPIVPSPSTMTVDYKPTPVLYLPNGRVLVRKAGY